MRNYLLDLFERYSWILASFILALLLCLVIVGSFYVVTPANANVGRLRAIEKVLGLHETKNNRTIRKIVGVNPARIPWCGGAVSYAVRKAGGRPVRGHLRALNWKRFGKAVRLSRARKGDVVVLRTKRGHHVSIYKGRYKGRVILCGGNQSNRFKCSSYRASSVLAVRR